MSSMIVWGAAKGSIGAHSEELEGQRWITSVTPKWVILSKVVWVVLFLQPLALGFVKLSVVFFCRRLIVGRAFDIVSWTLVVTIACWMAVFFFGLFFDCGVEFAANWGSLSHIAARCPFGFMPTIIYTILDSVLDLAVLILPLPWVSHMRDLLCLLPLLTLTCPDHQAPHSMDEKIVFVQLLHAWGLVSNQHMEMTLTAANLFIQCHRSSFRPHGLFH